MKTYLVRKLKIMQVKINNFSKNHPILLLGSSGSLGQSFSFYFPHLEFLKPNRNELDLADFLSVKEYFDKFRPNVVINCVGYTDVNGAEKNHQLAYKTNVVIPNVLSEVCSIYKIPLIHFSTDYVFDGASKSLYTEEDIKNPLNVYGESKLQGERAIQEI